MSSAPNAGRWVPSHDATEAQFERELGHAISMARRRARYTQAQLAGDVRIEPESLSRLERGKALPLPRPCLTRFRRSPNPRRRAPAR